MNDLIEYAPDWEDGSFDAKPGGGWYNAKDVQALEAQVSRLREGLESIARQLIGYAEYSPAKEIALIAERALLASAPTSQVLAGPLATNTLLERASVAGASEALSKLADYYADDTSSDFSGPGVARAIREALLASEAKPGEGQPQCECLVRDKEPSAYHNVKCPRYVAEKF